MKEFTRALYELFVKQGLGLSQCILIMSRKPKQDGVSRAAQAIYSALEKGSLFSNALKACGDIQFDEVYISFIRLAEKNGNLKAAVSYLLKKLEREADVRKRLFGASVYPAFVIVLAMCACVFTSVYTKTADFNLLAEYFAALVVVCGAAFFAIVKFLGNDKLYEAFVAVDFLLQNGIELSEAVGCAVQVAGPSDRVGKLFETAGLRLSYGMDLQTAFCCKKRILQEAFYYADTGGSQKDLFGRIASYLESEKEKGRTLCLTLVEPLFIAITGIFILMVLMTFFMPLINDLSLI